MRVKTFALLVEFDAGGYKVFHNLSRVAVKRYRNWYEENCFATYTVVEED